MIVVKQSDIVKAPVVHSPITGVPYITIGKGDKRVVIALKR